VAAIAPAAVSAGSTRAAARRGTSQSAEPSPAVANAARAGEHRSNSRASFHRLIKGPTEILPRFGRSENVSEQRDALRVVFKR
jgi:hypothetical protein